MSDNKLLYKTVVELMEKQLFAVLSTRGEKGPHSVIVSFVSADQMRDIIFVTPRKTRKFQNLRINSAASLFIDNRSNNITDLQRTIGVEAVGEVDEVSAEEGKSFIALYSAKYPEMENFILARTSAIMRMRVKRYEVVNNFQNVTVFELP